MQTSSHVEHKQLELAAQAAGIEYLMYFARCHQHPSGLLYRRDPASRLTVWNPLRDDGDLSRLAPAVPDVDLHRTIAEACAAGADDLARRVREAFVRAVTERVLAQRPASPQGPAQACREPDGIPSSAARQRQATSG